MTSNPQAQPSQPTPKTPFLVSITPIHPSPLYYNIPSIPQSLPQAIALSLPIANIKILRYSIKVDTNFIICYILPIPIVFEVYFIVIQRVEMMGLGLSEVVGHWLGDQGRIGGCQQIWWLFLEFGGVSFLLRSVGFDCELAKLQRLVWKFRWGNIVWYKLIHSKKMPKIDKFDQSPILTSSRTNKSLSFGTSFTISGQLCCPPIYFYYIFCGEESAPWGFSQLGQQASRWLRRRFRRKGLCAGLSGQGFKNGWLTAFMEYNQQIIMLRRAHSREKSANWKENRQIRDGQGDQTADLGQPRKRVKKNFNRDPDSEILEYSKIKLIPEKKLTIQEMRKDPIELLVQLEKEFQDYGGVKLITPPEWNPPFCFTYGQIGIKTRIQHIHKLRLGKSFKENEDAYNVRNFQKMAEEFQKQYKLRTNPQGKSDQEKLQQEYWSIVNNTTDGPDWKCKATVEYAADLPVNKLGSGFPLSQNYKSQDSNFNYYSSLYNLNNTYRSPSSILKVAEDKREHISGVTIPWVYMGMRFSTFCWHVEDLWLNSINYNHKGGTKTWYIIPRKYKEKFDKYVERKTGRGDLLGRITFMLDPLEIIRNGIPVYKANQRAGEYVCTFFKAYHAGFSHAFNVGQAVNFASAFSFDYIRQALKFIEQSKEKKPAVLSYDWLVYENKLRTEKGAPVQMQGSIDQKYKTLLNEQYEWIKNISEKVSIKVGHQIDASCKYDRNSCSKCRNYLYLSSLRCLDCHRNYCSRDFHNCCHGNFELVFRQPNMDRKWITAFLSKPKKQA